MITNSSMSRIVSKAFGLLGTDPGPLRKALDAAADFEDEARLRLTDIIRHIEDAPPDDTTRLLIHHALAQWDAGSSPAWADGTAAQTQARRDLLYLRLEVQEIADALQQHFPPYVTEFPEFTISEEFERWYNASDQESAGFYWPHYRDYLQDIEGWPAPSIAALRRATTGVIEGIAAPSRLTIYQSRGLVVGFVQSGKTANFTGAIARAIDAGYRLIIILAGTTNILREQTQRRLDKQLIGKETLLGLAGAADEYRNAPDWQRFISYGAQPGVLGACDWVRLTNLKSDYKRLGTGPGLAALEFEKLDETKPLFDQVNLQRMRTRLVVAKKNKAPLVALANDLERVQKAGIKVEEIPALIIDDESDQASLNTKKPSKGDIKRRTAINDAITNLLLILKRGQYVGYTATPSANVLTDPNDKLGIFPRSFIKSLERPLGYMGASDYHDFGEEREGFHSNERAYVRPVYGDDLSPENLQKAIDCYLLSGAIKLYRANKGESINGRHHTMLVHTSQKQDDHREMADQVNQLLDTGGYLDGTADARLATLFANDFRPVWEARAHDLAFPADYGECREYIAKCMQNLDRGPQRVLIVNGHKDNEPNSPDFDRDDVWKIIVGGTKLSRGYTVEGLTVSYYRRAATAADTLMQMGRWFGFRQGYTDLMRLFIGRAEGAKSLDLYEAFEAICRDEDEFRKELLQYAVPKDGSKPITPMRVPPIVTQHMPDLPVTAKNKRWNAVILSENFGGKAIAPTLATKERRETISNQQLAQELMADAAITAPILGCVDEAFSSLVGKIAPAAMIKFLSRYHWSKPGVLQRQIGFFDHGLGDPEIDRWLVVWPLLTEVGEHGVWPFGRHEVTVIERSRNANGRFGVYTTPAQVRAAKAIVLGENLANTTPDTNALAQPRTGLGLFYAVKSPQDREVTIGFYLLPPPNEIEEKIKWGILVEDKEDEPIVTIEQKD
jgi:hypothetical protein